MEVLKTLKFRDKISGEEFELVFEPNKLAYDEEYEFPVTGVLKKDGKVFANLILTRDGRINKYFLETIDELFSGSEVSVITNWGQIDQLKLSKNLLEGISNILLSERGADSEELYYLREEAALKSFDDAKEILWSPKSLFPFLVIQ